MHEQRRLHEGQGTLSSGQEEKGLGDSMQSSDACVPDPVPWAPQTGPRPREELMIGWAGDTAGAIGRWPAVPRTAATVTAVITSASRSLLEPDTEQPSPHQRQCLSCSGVLHKSGEGRGCIRRHTLRSLREARPPLWVGLGRGAAIVESQYWEPSKTNTRDSS